MARPHGSIIGDLEPQNKQVAAIRRNTNSHGVPTQHPFCKNSKEPPDSDAFASYNPSISASRLDFRSSKFAAMKSQLGAMLLNTPNVSSKVAFLELRVAFASDCACSASPISPSSDVFSASSSPIIVSVSELNVSKSLFALSSSSVAVRMSFPMSSLIMPKMDWIPLLSPLAPPYGWENVAGGGGGASPAADISGGCSK